MAVKQDWIMPALIIAGGFILWREIQRIKNLGKQAGEAVSKSIFDTLDFATGSSFNKPTIVDALPNGKGGFTCPFGYTLKFGQSRGWYCLISDGTKTDPQSKLPVAIGIPTGKNG